MRDGPRVNWQSLPDNIRPVGVFGRFSDGSGKATDVSLEGGPLHKAVSTSGPGLSELFAAADSLCREQRGKPLAYVGVGFGPALQDRSASASLKGDFVESEHPRWPKHQPDGGEFKDKDGSTAGATGEGRMDEAIAQGMILKDLKRSIDRRVARKLLRNRLIAVLRAGLGVAADVAPGVGEVFDAAELAQTVADFHETHVEADAAIQFVQGGSKALDSLRVSLEDEGFSSSRAFAKDDFEDDFEKRFGPAGDGYEYHHIVEQGGPNEKNIAPELLHSTENMIRIPKILHEEISSIYSKAAPDTEGLSLRQWLSTKPYAFQRDRGLKIMRDLGIIR